MNLDGLPVLCHWCYPRSWLWKLWMKHFIQGPKICTAQALGFSFLLDRAGTAHPIFFFLCCFFLSSLLSSSSEVIIQRSPRKCLVVSERGNCSEAQVQMSSIILDSLSSERPQLPALAFCRIGVSVSSSTLRDQQTVKSSTNINIKIRHMTRFQKNNRCLS